MPAKRKYNPDARRRAYLASKERAARLGFTSPSQQTRAKRLGFTKPDDYRSAKPTRGALAVFARHGVTRASFNSMRQQNRAHKPSGIDGGNPRTALARKIQTYNVALDSEVANLSDQRVGYIVSFYRAVTDDGTNFYSIKPSDRWIRENDGTLGPWRDTQMAYLVTYGGFHDLSHFDERYGDGATAAVIMNNAMG